MKIMHLLSASFIGLLLFSCQNEPSTDKMVADKTIDEENLSLNTNFDGKIFSVPSPVQTALLIKDLKVPFRVDLLHNTSSAKSYNTEYKKALNFGIYAVDLGYASTYDQKSVSLNYLSTIDELTKDLGLESTFNENFMKRFEMNISNEDSTMMIVSDAFKETDMYLKNARRRSTTALILTGGWIESMYIATKLIQLEANEKILTRIGEQKQSLKTVIDLLNEYNTDNTNDELISLFKALESEYDKVIFTYNYKPSKTNEGSKTTVLNHDVTIKIEPEVLESLSLKIEEIRNHIIKA